MSPTHRQSTDRAVKAKSLWTNRWVPIAIALLSGLSACETPSRWEAEKQYERGKALFEERCKNAAGEKIYRTVSDVEGVLLLKVPPRAGEAEWQDPDWPGAAFAHERAGGEEGYVESFLWYEQVAIRDGKAYQDRGAIDTRKTPYPGYRYVEAVNDQDGKRYRFTGRWEEPWQYDKSYLKGYVKFFLDKSIATGSIPRYGVTYEDHMDPADRSLGVASTTVRVVDTQTGEVLGEYTRFVWTPPFTLEGAKISSANPTPWLRARQCGGHSKSNSTRFFVDQVLIPRKEK